MVGMVMMGAWRAAKESGRIAFHVGGSLVLATLVYFEQERAANALAVRLRAIDLRLR